MKKIVAIFLLIAITTVFVSCGDGDKDGNQTTLNTNINNIESTTEGTTEPQGIVLTTDPTKMAQWGYATEFIPTEYTQPTVPTVPTVSVPLISESQLERPSVNISQATVSPENTTTNGGATTSDGGSSNNGGTSSGNNSGPTVSEITTPTEETPTTQVQRSAMPISGSSHDAFPDRKGEFLDSVALIFPSTGWDGGIVSAKGTCTVTYAGKSFDVPCSVSGSIYDNNDYAIIVTLTGLEIPAEGFSFTVTIGEDFIKNSTNTQYNMATTRNVKW